MRWLLSILLLACLGAPSLASPAPQPILVGYLFPQKNLLQPGDVDPTTIDRINYAFANIDHGRMVEGYENDARNFAFLTALRDRKPEFKVLVSVGGWLWSGGFSDAALTAESRRIFIDSAVDFLRRYNLDGLDIDWEYPALAGATNNFRAEDKRNYTLLLKELRKRFDREQGAMGRRLLLTVAAGAGLEFLDHTEMRKAARSLDTVNLMAYDYVEPTDGGLTGHHAPLYADASEPRHFSTDQSVQAFLKAGVPASKLLLGVPFYGHLWGQVADVNHGLHQTGKTVPNAYAPYSAIDPGMMAQGFQRYWDPVAGVPWLYNADKQQFVSYEDPQSLALKCEYIHRKKLGGMMFWSYEADARGVLRKAAWKCLQQTGSPAKSNAGAAQ